MYREVFKLVSAPPDPGAVLYTITSEDVRKTRISTTAGDIPVVEFMGRVVPDDVGRRIYRVPFGEEWIWQVENSSQRHLRLAHGSRVAE
jgi:hypothetical protein